MSHNYPIIEESLTDNTRTIVATSFQVLMPEPEGPRLFNSRAEAEAFQQEMINQKPNAA